MGRQTAGRIIAGKMGRLSERRVIICVFQDILELFQMETGAGLKALDFRNRTVMLTA